MTWTARTTTVAALAVSLAVAMIGWALWPAPTPPAGSAVELKPITRVETVKKIRIVPKTVVVYRDRAKVATGLPESVQADPDKHITATGHLDADERPYSLAAVLDATTGESVVYAMPEPLPWIGRARQTALAAGFVMRDTGPTWRLKARQDVIRVKALHAMAEAQLDGDGAWSAGAYIEWRF